MRKPRYVSLSAFELALVAALPAMDLPVGKGRERAAGAALNGITTVQNGFRSPWFTGTIQSAAPAAVRVMSEVPNTEGAE